MYLLYVDESGNPDGAEDRYFILGGIAVSSVRRIGSIPLSIGYRKRYSLAHRLSFMLKP